MSKFITNLSASTALTGAELLETAQLSLAVRISAATISAAAADNSYNDSANGFVAAGFAVGDRVNVTGFVASVVNNIIVGTVTAIAAGKLTIGGTDGDVIVDNVAGDTVVIAKWLSASATPDALAGRAAFAGFASIVSPAQIVADQNDYNPANLATAAFLRINSDAARSITGLKASTAGRQLILTNIGAFTITLKSQDAGSTAANRFALSANIDLPADASIKLVYDTVSSRWRSIGSATGSGGGSSARVVANFGAMSALAGFTQDNTSADRTIVETAGKAITCAVKNAIGATNVHGLRKAVPVGGTPYRVAIFVQSNNIGGLLYHGPAFGWSNGVAHKLTYDQGGAGEYATWTNSSTRGGPSTLTPSPMKGGAGGYWIGLHDDGTNFLWEVSADGGTFHRIQSVARDATYNQIYIGHFSFKSSTLADVGSTSILYYDENGLARTVN